MNSGPWLTLFCTFILFLFGISFTSCNLKCMPKVSSRDGNSCEPFCTQESCFFFVFVFVFFLFLFLLKKDGETVFSHGTENARGVFVLQKLNSRIGAQFFSTDSEDIDEMTFLSCYEHGAMKKSKFPTRSEALTLCTAA